MLSHFCGEREKFVTGRYNRYNMYIHMRVHVCVCVCIFGCVCVVFRDMFGGAFSARRVDGRRGQRGNALIYRVPRTRATAAMCDYIIIIYVHARKIRIRRIRFSKRVAHRIIWFFGVRHILVVAGRPEWRYTFYVGVT